MIISASRRTDIPSYYSEWFFNRIKAGYVCVRNPMNPRQVSKISLSPEVVDAIVFWTKNPESMLPGLGELADYPFYFQFSLTGYGQDVESNIPHKKEHMIPIFQKLSEQIGRKRVIWRYDPILFSDKYSVEYHLKAFAQIAEALEGYTDRCIISFVDTYTKNSKAMQMLGAWELQGEQLRVFAAQLSAIAGRYHMSIATCAETVELIDCGIGHSSCVDRELLEEIIGCRLELSKDKNQRKECGCVESIDIGTYNTCRNGCKYCYANHSMDSVERNCRLYDVNSPILCGGLTAQDIVIERKVKSLKQGQLSLWD